MKNYILFLVLIFSSRLSFSQTPELWGMTSQGGTQDYGVAFKINGDGTGFWKVHDFTIGNPGSSPLQVTLLNYDGWLYGTTTGGWRHDGVIFRYDPVSSRYEVLHVFNNSFDKDGADPMGSLVLSSTGKIFGCANQGGNYFDGTIFELDPETNQFSVVHNFKYGVTGAEPLSMINGNDGYLYGTARYGDNGHGSLFRFDPVTFEVTMLYTFNPPEKGKFPNTDLTLGSDGKLYGTTRGGGENDYGVIFSFNLNTGNYNREYSFTNTQKTPVGKLVEISNGKFLGTIQNNGPNNAGSFYSYDVASEIYQVLFTFGGVTIAIYPSGYFYKDASGWLYGATTYNTKSYLFRFDPVTLVYEELQKFDVPGFDARYPTSGFTMGADSSLYSLSYYGGTSEEGTIYRLNPTTLSAEKVIDFNLTKGVHPFGSFLPASDGYLYALTGNTNYSGYDSGAYTPAHPPPTNYPLVLEKITPSSGEVTVLETNLSGLFWGNSTESSVIEASNGKLYGVTTDANWIFNYNPATGTTLTTCFMPSYNYGPIHGSLLEASNGMLYGLSSSKFSTGSGGKIFKVDPANNSFQTVYSIEEYTDGNDPSGSLIQASDGLLYGMCRNLGTNSNTAGVIFSFNTGTSQYTKRYEFTNPLNGMYPFGSLLEGSDGYLYGMTSKGGTFDAGVIFRFNPANNQLTKLWDFDNGLLGGEPHGDLMQASNGKFYGMTLTGGLNDKGVIFAFDPDVILYEVIENFTVNEKGAFPFGNLIEVNAPAAVIYTMPDTVACLGGSVTLLAIGTGGYLYHTWYHDGLEVGGNAKGLVLENVSLSDTGKYWCVISNALATVTSDTIHLAVVDPPLVTLSAGGNDSVCTFSGPVQLTGSPVGGFYSGIGVNGDLFYPAISGAGTFNAYYTYSAPCVMIDTVKIVVSPSASVVSPGDTVLCSNVPPVLLVGNPAGGIFSGPGVDGNYFNPALSGIGTFVIHYFFDEVCSSGDSIIITVGEVGLEATINPIGDNIFCPGEGAVDLSGFPFGGSFSGTGVSLGQFNPAVAGPGQHSIYYTFSNLCVTPDTMIVTVPLVPEISIISPVDTSFCTADTLIILEGFPSGGFFYGDGINGNEFNPSSAGAGTHLIYYEYSDTCVTLDSIIVTITESVQSSFMGINDTSVCFSSSPLELNAIPPGGVFSGSGVAGGIFYPSDAGPGTHLISYSFDNDCIVPGQLLITVTGIADVSITNPGDTLLCFNDLPIQLTGSPAGGNFYGAGVTGNLFDPIAAGEGTHVTYYSFTDTCSATDSIYVTVANDDLAFFTGIGDTTVCINSGAIPLNATPPGGDFSGDGVLQNLFYPSQAGTGTHPVYYLFTADCITDATILITVADVPEVSFVTPGDTVVCYDGSLVTLQGSPSGGVFSGDGVNGNSFNPALAGIGTHFIYYTYSDTCSATDSISVIVNSCTGIADVLISDFKIEPNPFTDVLKVSLPEKTIGTKTHFRMLDNLGKVVAEGRISSPVFFIQRNQLSAGLYLLVIESEKNQQWKKVVIE